MPTGMVAKAHRSLLIRPVVLAQVVPPVYGLAGLVRERPHVDGGACHERLGAKAFLHAFDHIDGGEHLLQATNPSPSSLPAEMAPRHV